MERQGEPHDSSYEKTKPLDPLAPAYDANTIEEVFSQDARDDEGTVVDAERGASGVEVLAPPDSPYGWLIVLAAFLTCFFVFGYVYSWGVLQQHLQKHVFVNNTNTLQISIIGSLAAALLCLLGPIVHPVQRRIGRRWTMLIGVVFSPLSLILASFATELWQYYLTQGFLFGLTAPFIFFPTISGPAEWFEKKRGLASGIAIAGSGLGGLALSPLLQYLIGTVGYQWALRILAFIGFVFLTIALCLSRPRIISVDRSAVELSEKQNGRLRELQILSNTKFALLLVFGFFVTFGFLTPFFMVSTHAQFIGLSVQTAATLTGIMSGVNSAARVAIGSFADYAGRVNTMFLCSFLAGIIGLVVWPLATSFSSLLAFVILYGIFGGGFVALYPVVVAELVRHEDIQSAVGLVYASNFFGNAFGPPIAGLLLDMTGRTNFLPMFMFTGGITVFSSMFILIIRFMLDRRLWIKK
ncbi:uncharacterized protein VTP21DRAFT_4573 [Calcarisporiella thermophila]|uniref:uncharacterized protein n=1 Tax=Calcarisporiella thermophila TaxID=911321 RepID=UPI003742F203